jgi:hypothetical protein
MSCDINAFYIEGNSKELEIYNYLSLMNRTIDLFGVVEKLMSKRDEGGKLSHDDQKYIMVILAGKLAADPEFRINVVDNINNGNYRAIVKYLSSADFRYKVLYKYVADVVKLYLSEKKEIFVDLTHRGLVAEDLLIMGQDAKSLVESVDSLLNFPQDVAYNSIPGLKAGLDGVSLFLDGVTTGLYQNKNYYDHHRSLDEIISKCENENNTYPVITLITPEYAGIQNETEFLFEGRHLSSVSSINIENCDPTNGLILIDDNHIKYTCTPNGLSSVGDVIWLFDDGSQYIAVDHIQYLDVSGIRDVIPTEVNFGEIYEFNIEAFAFNYNVRPDGTRVPQITVTLQDCSSNVDFVEGGYTKQRYVCFGFGSPGTKEGIITSSSTGEEIKRFSVNVVEGDNNAPVAVDDNATVDLNGTASISVLSNDTDSDGSIDPTSVSIKTYTTNGTLTTTNEGIIIYKPNSGFTGVDSFTYNVKDDKGAVSNDATVTITVGDDISQQELGNFSGGKTYETGSEAGITYDIRIDNLTDNNGILTGKYTLVGFEVSVEIIDGRKHDSVVEFKVNPPANVACTHIFTGTLSGSTIEGTFTTQNNCHGSGKWSVSRDQSISVPLPTPTPSPPEAPPLSISGKWTIGELRSSYQWCDINNPDQNKTYTDTYFENMVLQQNGALITGVSTATYNTIGCCGPVNDTLQVSGQIITENTVELIFTVTDSEKCHCGDYPDEDQCWLAIEEISIGDSWSGVFLLGGDGSLVNKNNFCADYDHVDVCMGKWNYKLGDGSVPQTTTPLSFSSYNSSKDDSILIGTQPLSSAVSSFSFSGKRKSRNMISGRE